MAGIFISYRRQDSQSAAGRLGDELKERLPEAAIFRDVETIEPGVDFVEAINRALNSCNALLAVIGPRWLTLTDQDGRRRLDDPNDYTRLEVGTALKREGVRVIPVLVEGASMPSSDELPEELKALGRRNAIELTDKRWKYDVGELETTLRQLLGLPAPASMRTSSPAANLPWKWIAGAVGLLVVAVAAYFTIGRETPVQRVTVPNVVGMPVDQAMGVLTEIQLTGQPQERQSDATPPGRVESTQPGAQEQVAPNSRVVLFVSAAPSKVEVPNLKGLELDRAVEKLLTKGLKLGKTVYEPRERPEDSVHQVHKQSPEAELKIERGGRVDLWLWGPSVTLPNVIGNEADKAAQTLKNFGLRSQLKYAAIDTVKAGVVIGQSPEGETVQGDGALVTLTVSEAKSAGSTAPTVALSPKVLEALRTKKVLINPTRLTH